MNQNTSNQNLYDNEKNMENESTLEQESYEEGEEIETSSHQQYNNDNGKEEFRSKMIKMFAIVLIALFIILGVGFIISLFNKKTYTYSDIEDIMEKAAESYFKDNKNKLPKNETEIVEINTTILTNHKYMKSLDKYIKDQSCSGKVSVEKKSSTEYSYAAELKCDDYSTTNFYKKIIDSSNVVKEGFGLYYINNEYVYRGTDVSNYVRFSDSEDLWRIVKVTGSNEVVLIANEKTKNSFAWDNRYNNATKQTSGINTFKNSNISTILKRLYTNTLNEGSKYHKYDDVAILTDRDKKKIVEHNACVGPRAEEDTSRNGTSECSITETTKLSLLPVYDFINASLDVNCNSAEKKDCQNYNYLAPQYSSYWLANGKKEDTSKVYQVTGLKYIVPAKASSESFIRVVIHLSPDAMFEKGSGTLDDPYVIR